MFLKVSSFRIKNFRSIKEIEVNNCQDMMVFIGRNNAGKSNVLRALDVFFNASKPVINDIPYFAKKGDQIILSVTFDNLDRKFRKTLNIKSDKLVYQKKYPIAEKDGKLKVGTLNEEINHQHIREYINKNNPSLSSLERVRSFLKKNLPRYYYVSALRDLADEEKFKRGSLIQELFLPLLEDEVTTSTDSISYHIERIQEILKDRCTTAEKEIANHLRNRIDDFDSIFIDLSTIDIKKALAPNLMVKTKSSSELINAINQGAGTQNFIILALAQYLAKGTEALDLIIAFEEPEISLHPTAQRNMLDMIFYGLKNTRRQQIMLTTHSTIFIDNAVDNVYLVKKSDGKTVVTIPEKLTEIVRLLGLKGSDYLTSDAIIFIEGVTDYEIFTIWAEAVAPPEWKKYTFTFVPLGGLYSFDQINPDDFLRVCSCIYAILDSDKRSQSDSLKQRTQNIVRKIENNLKGHVRILSKREIENYFTKEALEQVFPLSKDNLDEGLINNDFSPMKDHLTKIIQEEHRLRNQNRPDYDEERTQSCRYSPYYAKKVAMKMVELNQVPEEFINILKDFAYDLSRKLPKY